MFSRASTFQAFSAALERTLYGGRIRSMREVRDLPNTYVLELRTPGQNHLLSFYLSGGFVLFEERTAPAPSHPSAFTMYCRKHVVGGQIEGIEVDPPARTLRLRIAHRDTSWILCFESDHDQSNLYLLNDASEVVQCASHRILQQRKMQLGAPYTRAKTRPLRDDDQRPEDTWPRDESALWSMLREQMLREDARARRQAERTRLRRRLKRADKRAKRRVQNVLKDLERAENADALRHEADLLQSAQHRLQRGMTHIDIPDWTQDMQPTRITLDPSQPIQEEIRQRYRTYRRMKDAETTILTRLETVEAQRDETQAARKTFETLETLEEMQALARRLERRGILPRTDQAQRVREIARKPYREARSSDGFRILVGRSAKDNDTLTLRIARGRDLWMHARDVAGSHVIIWRENRSDVIPERTIQEAALVAAQYSNAKNDTTVDVGYTERKHVSKAKGAPPGSVHVAAMRTMLVTPDPARCQELFARAKAHRLDAAD